MHVELVSWETFYQLARQLALMIRTSGFCPDVIVGIARGGVVPARVLCDYLDVMELACVRVEHYRARHKVPKVRVQHPLSIPIDGRRVLVVDDVSDTGDSFRAALEHLAEKGRPLEVRSCALQHKTVSSFVPDYYAREIRAWRWVTYPWAVIEDLGELISAAGLIEAGLDEIQKVLDTRHGIQPSIEQIEDALAALRLEADEGRPELG